MAEVAAAEIPPFTAKYALHQGSIKIGTVKLSYQLLPNGQHQLTTVTEPDGVISFIRDDVVTEQSTFTWQDQRPHPVLYAYHQTGDEDDRHVELNFDWTSKVVTNTVMGHSWRMTIPENTQDKVSVQLALMQALLNEEQTLHFPVADGGKLKMYQFERLGETSLEINERDMPTLKMSRQKDGNKVDTRFWCAPEYFYLPVRVEKEKKLGLFSMDLVRVRFQRTPEATSD